MCESAVSTCLLTTLEAWLGKAWTKKLKPAPWQGQLFFFKEPPEKETRTYISMFELLINNHLTWLTCHFFLWKKNYRFILATIKPFAISQWHVTSLTISREEQCALPSLKTVASAHGTVAHHTTQSHCFNQSVAFGRGGKNMSGFCGLLAWRGNNWKNVCGTNIFFYMWRLQNVWNGWEKCVPDLWFRRHKKFWMPQT